MLIFFASHGLSNYDEQIDDVFEAALDGRSPRYVKQKSEKFLDGRRPRYAERSTEERLHVGVEWLEGVSAQWVTVTIIIIHVDQRVAIFLKQT